MKIRNIFKKLAAPLALVMAVSAFTGCYSEDNLWSARKGDFELSIGSYIYFLSSASNEARTKVSEKEEVLKSEIEGVPAEEWIRTKTEDNVKITFYIDEKFKEMGLELDDEDLKSINSYTESMWKYYKTSLEEIGVSKESFSAVYSESSVKESKIFTALYGKDGEKEVSDKELKDFFTESYFTYEHFTVTLEKDTETDTYTAEDKADAEKMLGEYLKKVKAGEMTISEAAEDYKTVANLETSTYKEGESKIEDASGVAAEAILKLKENEVTVVEISEGNYILTKRTAVAEKADKKIENETTRESLLSAMKWEEFAETIKEDAKGIDGIEFNKKSINMQKLSKFLSEDYKKGTISEAPSSSLEDDNSSSLAEDENSSSGLETSNEASE